LSEATKVDLILFYLILSIMPVVHS